MTSIEKDLRDLVERWEGNAQGSTIAWMWRDRASDLESLIPRIVAAVEQAQADAIQGAIEIICGYCNPKEILNLSGKFDETGRFHMDSTGSKYPCRAEKLHSLTPRRVQIEAELRMARAMLAEAELADKEWRHIADAYDWAVGTDAYLRIPELRGNIATLERELEAERKRGQK